MSVGQSAVKHSISGRGFQPTQQFLRFPDAFPFSAGFDEGLLSYIIGIHSRIRMISHELRDGSVNETRLSSARILGAFFMCFSLWLFKDEQVT